MVVSFSGSNIEVALVEPFGVSSTLPFRSFVQTYSVGVLSGMMP